MDFFDSINVNNSLLHEGDIALNTSDILSNFGGDVRNNLINTLHLNDENNLFTTKKSLYYDIDGLVKVLNSTSNDSLSIFSLNIQCINSKLNQLKLLINQLNQNKVVLDVLCLQESWVNPNDDIELFNLDGYHMISKPLNPNCSKHGGLLMYINNSIKIINIEKFDGYRTFEGLLVNLKTIDNKTMGLLNIYRPPSNENRTIDDFLSEFFTLLTKLHSQNKNLILTGDFNIDLLDLEHFQKHASFFDSMLNLHFTPKITFPTRFGNTHATLIDHIYCKCTTTNSSSLSGILLSDISDHCPTFIVINSKVQCKPCTPKFIYRTIYSAESDLKFKSELENVKFDDILDFSENGDPNSNYRIFLSTIVNLRDKYFPLKRVKFNKYKHKNSDWITNSILISIRYRDKLYRRKLATSTDSVYYNTICTNLKTYNKILRNVINQAKKMHNATVFNKYKNDIKSTWKQINYILHNRKGSLKLPTFLKGENDSTILSKSDIAERFNNYFINIGPNLASKMQCTGKKPYQSYLSSIVDSQFHFKNVSCEDVTSVIRNLKSKNTSGSDRISTSFLKKYSYILAKPLTLLINQSLEYGIFPEQLKTAKVLPIYKENDLNINDVSSYRPISILPSFSKVYEKIVHIQLYSYFTMHNLFYDHQYGFRKNHSTEYAALELHDMLIQYLDKGKIPISIFIDLSKAFDTIDHDILLKKMSFYGINDNALKWFTSYLAHRNQYVSLENTTSSSLEITTGVPQGSILGPLLFLIYVNDLPVCTNCKFLMYADDTCLLTPIDVNTNTQTINDAISVGINIKLQSLYDWLVVNKLSLNVSKTKFMLFHFLQKHIEMCHVPALEINGTPIKYVTEMKFLGIHFDNRLLFDKHINEIANKISRINGVLSKLKLYLPVNILTIIYNCLLLPYLTYGITIWGFGQCDRLRVLQKKAIRNVTNSSYLSHCQPLCKQLRCLLFDDLLKLSILKLYYKHCCKNIPSYFLNSNFILLNNVNHERRTINRPTIFDNFINPYSLLSTRLVNVQHSNRYLSEKCLRYYIPILINSDYVSISILEKVSSVSFHCFVHSCKQHILSKYNNVCNVYNCYVCNVRL